MRTIKYFFTILLGHCIIVYIDHKNLTFENFPTERVLRWLPMLEEYRPETKYIKGTENDAVEALGRLPLINSDVAESDITREHLAESYYFERLDSDKFPLTYQTIDKYQRKDKNMVEK